MKILINLFKNNKFKMMIILAILLFFYTTICAFSYASNISSDISDSVFRLHVIANSDSEEDQNLKYVVRDALLEYMNELCTDCTSKDEAIAIVKENLQEFQNIALETVKNEGYDYSVNIYVGNFEFPTKSYGDISLPAGYYDALKVEIGEATGQNWWCVMFPPLCFTNVTSGVVSDDSTEILEDSLSEEELAIISEDSDVQYKFKFKLLEFFSG